MAGVKITDLGILTTAVDADLLYIVDVSDTSQSPQGTSKQIEVGNIVKSGSWTPTVTSLSGFDSEDVILATYQTIGNICQFSIWFSAAASTPIADGDNGSIGFSLPNGYTTDDVSIAAGFISNYPSRDYPTIGNVIFNGSSSITVSFTADSPTIDIVEGTIQGQFIIL
jgi:hypothetical protein